MTSNCRSKTCNPTGPEGLTVSPEIIAETAKLRLNNDDLFKYKKLLAENIDRGLAKTTNPDAVVKCFPTYVQNIPDGKETGKYLALDFGGSKYRVLLVTFENGQASQEVKMYEIPHELMTGEGEALFDFLANCLAEFVEERGLKEENIPLGFTFSFPLVQKGLTVGILERWTKGFTCADVIGQNVVKLLDEALERKGGVHISVKAVLNDTTGTLLACAFKNPLCRIGLIIGTGTNCCYLEDQSKAELFDEPDEGTGKVIINMESGAFGDDGALDYVRTEYDDTVDKQSPNPGKQKHEKMISGMYMGEIVRQIAAQFTKQGIMFGGKGSDDLFTPDKFETRFVSEIESDPDGGYDNVKSVCEQLNLADATEQDYINLRYLCELVSRRAAYMVSAELATLIDRIAEPKVVVGIDGTLYKNHPHFHDVMTMKIKDILDNPQLEFELMLSEDGSGIGAALVAAVAAKLSESAN